MEVEKLSGSEMRRIEKYVEELVNKKIRNLEGCAEEKREAKKKLRENVYLNGLLKEYERVRNRIKAAENKYGVSHSNYDGGKFDLDYEWKSKTEDSRQVRIAKIQKAHNRFVEILIFKGKPEILKAIKAIEAI